MIKKLLRVRVKIWHCHLAWRVTWNYAYNPFNILIFLIIILYALIAFCCVKMFSCKMMTSSFFLHTTMSLRSCCAKKYVGKWKFLFLIIISLFRSVKKNKRNPHLFTKHLFNCPENLTFLTARDLWNNVASILKLEGEEDENGWDPALATTTTTTMSA